MLRLDYSSNTDKIQKKYLFIFKIKKAETQVERF
jgi:hypothetical protein